MTIIAVISVIFLGMVFGLGQMEKPPELNLVKTSFTELPCWHQEDLRKGFVALTQSCTAILNQNPTRPFNNRPEAGSMQDWQKLCLQAKTINPSKREEVRAFFETNFVPYLVRSNQNSQGVFTGYYLPVIFGDLKPSAKYPYPVYATPADLVKVNLNAFDPALGCRTLIGRVKNNKLYPYPTRSEIENGAIKDSSPVLFYSDNKVDVAFAQIQGSAILQLPDHKHYVIHYAGTNGRAYTAIGKTLIEKNALKKQDVSMHSIRAWLNDHPNEVDTILDSNASYVFFEMMKTNQVVGTQQVPLTPRHSLAVDTRYISLGTPIWLDTIIPIEQKPFRHLMVAQDTGGAIKGAVRGDVYWGEGPYAAQMAGYMNSPGRYWVLFPCLRR